MRPWPQARQVSSSSAAGARAEDGTGPVHPTSRGDSSPAGAVCGVAEATSTSSEAPSEAEGVADAPVAAAPAPGTPGAPGAPGAVPGGVPGVVPVAVPVAPAAARGLTTRSAPQASQKLDSAEFAAPHAGQSRV